MYLLAWCRGRSQFRCLAAAGSICLELRPIRVGYARKVCRMLSPNAGLRSICILGWNLLTIHARKKVGRIGLSVPREGFRSSSYSSIRLVCCFEFLLYAAPIALRCWKHSRQNTGRPCVGRKGTVVSFPHCEQFVFVSERIGEPSPPPPPPSAPFALPSFH